MKKIRIIILLFIISASAFSQIEPTPSSYKKIKFTYAKTPNFLIEKKIVYADTNLFKFEFPNLEFQKVKSPTDSLITIGKIALVKFKDENLRNLTHLISHSLSISKAEFKLKSGVTEIESVLFDERAKTLYPDLFNSSDKFNIIPLSTTKFVTKNNKSRQMNLPFNYKETNNNLTVQWEKEYPTVGVYKYKTNNKTFVNILIINPELPRNISPTHLFSNCEYGVDTIISLYSTTKLISVKYE